MPWQHPGPHGYVPPGAPRRPDGSYYKPDMSEVFRNRSTPQASAASGCFSLLGLIALLVIGGAVAFVLFGASLNAREDQERSELAENPVAGGLYMINKPFDKEIYYGPVEYRLESIRINDSSAVARFILTYGESSRSRRDFVSVDCGDLRYVRIVPTSSLDPVGATRSYCASDPDSTVLRVGRGESTAVVAEFPRSPLLGAPFSLEFTDRTSVGPIDLRTVAPR